MEEKLAIIKQWLGAGSVNIFGLPMSGKDTVGVRLARELGGRFLSSGMIIRAMEEATQQNLTGAGQLVPTNLFYKWVLPYFERRDLWDLPLVLSSIGRWAGEENQVMTVAKASGHPIKAALFLKVRESEVKKRWQTAKELGDRGTRADDLEAQAFQRRIEEFRDKTVPVLQHYDELGLLINVGAELEREKVFAAVIDALYDFSRNNPN